MRVLLILTLLAAPAASQETKCNYVTLVKCFINILDEWAWTLYELKDNVVTITEDQCKHLRDLDKCIKDELPEPHQCRHEEVVEVSNTVSDLLTHRKDSGSFLKSYYLLTYACSAEGQEVLTNHRECLKNEKIGEMTLSAGTYLSDKFLDDHSDKGDDQICEHVNGKLKEYVNAMSGLCRNEASHIMCRSLTNMFKGLHADKLDNCELDCAITAEPSEEESKAESEEVSPVASEPDAQAGPVGAAPGAVVFLFAPLLALLLR